jgi:peptidoglycan/LPS O-acetylase OafA/YrhL
MVIGAFGAYLVSTKSTFKKFIVNLPRYFIVQIYILLLIIYLFRANLISYHFYISLIERQLIAVIFIFIILEQCFSINSLFKLSKFHLISKYGAVSYGLYCFHFAFILFALIISKMGGIDGHLFTELIFVPFLSLTLTIFTANISYKYFEMPFLKLKDKFAFIVKG